MNQAKQTASPFKVALHDAIAEYRGIEPDEAWSQIPPGIVRALTPLEDGFGSDVVHHVAPALLLFRKAVKHDGRVVREISRATFDDIYARINELVGKDEHDRLFSALTDIDAEISGFLHTCLRAFAAQLPFAAFNILGTHFTAGVVAMSLAAYRAEEAAELHRMFAQTNSAHNAEYQPSNIERTSHRPLITKEIFDKAKDEYRRLSVDDAAHRLEQHPWLNNMLEESAKHMGIGLEPVAHLALLAIECFRLLGRAITNVQPPKRRLVVRLDGPFDPNKVTNRTPFIQAEPRVWQTFHQTNSYLLEKGDLSRAEFATCAIVFAETLQSIVNAAYTSEEQHAFLQEHVASCRLAHPYTQLVGVPLQTERANDEDDATTSSRQAVPDPAIEPFEIHKVMRQHGEISGSDAGLVLARPVHTLLDFQRDLLGDALYDRLLRALAIVQFSVTKARRSLARLDDEIVCDSYRGVMDIGNTENGLAGLARVLSQLNPEILSFMMFVERTTAVGVTTTQKCAFKMLYLTGVVAMCFAAFEAAEIQELHSLFRNNSNDEAVLSTATVH